MSRSTVYYGSEDENKQDRPFVKYYSSIIPVEIVHDKLNNTTKIITFVGGDAYSAPIVHIKQTGTNAIDAYHYLHRDYLGSIMAITDEVGNIVEQRQFGAWGVVDKFLDSSGNTTFDNNSLLNRGYTGHEHFFGVALIHMNGRMYDAKLGRFLSPDNFIQDPYNTQNFNRYGYVLNNPLMYSDPSGECILVAALIGAAISVTVNGINNALHDRYFFQGAGMAAATGFIAGGFASVIGAAIGAGGGFANFAVQTLSHAHLGGVMTAMTGGNYWHGFASGAVGSMVASGVGSIFGANANPWARGVAMVGAGGLSGGVGSVIAGGNFWDGARNGLISAALNHVAHRGLDRIAKAIHVLELKKQQLNNIIGRNSERILIESLLIEALLETTTYGDALGYVRDSLSEVYGNVFLNEINEAYGFAIETLSTVKDVAKIPDSFVYKTTFALAADITSLHAQNSFYSMRVNYISNRINNYESILKSHGVYRYGNGGWGGAGSSGPW